MKTFTHPTYDLHVGQQFERYRSPLYSTHHGRVTIMEVYRKKIVYCYENRTIRDLWEKPLGDFLWGVYLIDDKEERSRYNGPALEEEES